MARTRKEPVRLRERKLTNGNISLYLDIYSEGQREYEFLKLYLVAGRDPISKEANRQTLALAEAIKAERIIELQAGRYGFSRKADRIPFYDYAATLGERRKGATQETWMRIITIMQEYDSSNPSLSDITSKWVAGFIKFLSTFAPARGKKGQPRLINVATQRLYLSKLSAMLNAAVNDGLITTNPLRTAVKPKAEAAERQYLTVDELRALAATPSRLSGDTKRAFLFACATGLRWSDVKKLTWSEVVATPSGGWCLSYRQQKTSKQETLDLSAMAVALLGERGEGAVFKLSSKQVEDYRLKKWLDDAGITKHITFHCARHTFAVQLLDQGVDIYTVSKLLGHSNLETTQVYAKVLDRAKREAVNLMPDFLGDCR
jgi:integrase